MRGAVEGLASRAPLSERLPSILQEDDFLSRFLTGFDTTLAPVLTTLDSLASYVDPALTPEDFLTWLASWVAVEIDEQWSLAQRRTVVASAARMHRATGTIKGLKRALELAFGADVTIVESGGCTWSAAPGGTLPGSDTAEITIRMAVPDPAAVDARRVHAVVEQSKPAHIRHIVDLVGGKKK